jgi:hypothetical protein
VISQSGIFIILPVETPQKQNLMKKLFTLLMAAVFGFAITMPEAVTAQNNCPAPTGLTSANVTNTGAQLSWTLALTSSYSSLQYRPVGSPTWNTQIVQALPYQLQNLNCGTTYEWQVQAACVVNGAVQLSAFSGIETFSTLSCNTNCPAPQNLSVTNVSATGVVLNWSATAPGTAVTYNIQYQQAGGTTWTSINNVTSTMYQLGGLTCNTAYIFQVQAVCLNSATGTTTLSPWSPLFTFITAACPTGCPAPTALASTNISLYGAVLSWTNAPAPVVSYQLRFRIAGTVAWTLISNATTPYQLGNLTCGTGYEWQLRTVCASTAGNVVSYSPWSPVQSFTTLNCTNTCPAPIALTSTNITMMGAVLSWTATAPAPVTYQLRYRVSGTVTWTLINNVTSTMYQLGNLVCATSYQWQVRTVCASTTGAANFSSWSPIASFTTLGCNTSCPAPTMLTASTITLSSAVLSWTVLAPVPVTFQLRYREASSATWTFVNNATSPYQLTNLNCGTAYVWQVRTSCSNSGTNSLFSPWSPLHTFITLSCTNQCPTPTGLTSSNISAFGAVLSWTSSSPVPVVYQIEYRPAGSTTWTLIGNASSPYQLGNLICSTPYEWRVRTVCPNTVSNATFSPWSAVETFTTAVCPNTCPSPVNLVTTNITPNSALVSWTPSAPAASMYQFRYRVNGTLAWTLLSVPGTSYQLGNLICDTEYQWQVRTVCTITGAVSYSPWSLLSYFTTLTCNVNLCPAPTGLTANMSVTGGMLTWNAVTGAQAYNVRYRNTNGASYITATTTNTFLQIGNLTPGTAYEWQVQAVCASSSTGVTTLSPWSPPSFFTTLLMLSVYPNPASDRVTVSFNAEESAVSVIVLRDMFGKTVYSTERAMAKGINEWNIDLSGIKDGWYSLTVSTGSVTGTQKLFVGR